jgi:hypothetical protein
VGTIALPLHLGLAFVPLALFALLLSRRGEDEIVEEAAQFTPMMRTSHTVLEMVSPENAESVAEAAEAAEASGAAEAAEATAEAEPVAEDVIQPAPDPGALLKPPPSSAPTTGTAESRPAG